MGKDDLIDYLIKLSEGKLFLVKQLLTLTEQQSKNINSEKAGKLEEIIEQKQSIMTRIDVLDKEFVEKYDVLKGDFVLETLEGLEVNQKNNMKVLQNKITKIHLLTERIQELDLANVEKLKKNLQSVQSELKKVKTSKKVIQGYSNKGTEGISIFVDKRR